MCCRLSGPDVEPHLPPPHPIFLFFKKKQKRDSIKHQNGRCQSRRSYIRAGILGTNQRTVTGVGR